MASCKNNSASSSPQHSPKIHSITASDWEPAAFFKRSIRFDKSSESYEGERNDGRETKRCRLLSAGDTSATNARLAGVYPSSVVTSSASTSGTSHSSREYYAMCSSSSGLRLIQLAYAGSDSSSPTQSPSPSPKALKVAVTERTKHSASPRSSTPTIASSSASPLVKNNESSYTSVGQLHVSDDRPGSSTELTTSARESVPESSVVKDSATTSTKGFRHLGDFSVGAASRSFVPRSTLLASKTLGIRLAVTEKPVNGHADATRSPNSHNSAESSTLSFNIINRSGHDFMGPLTANGHVREVFDSEEASTSELRNVDSSEQHASPHSDASSVSTQNGINLKVLLTNGTLKAPRKRVLSERGEAEAKYPVVDKRTLFNSWRGSRLLQPGCRNSGVGLFNYSNDCFLNAVLQTLVHTAPLARYVAELHSCSNYSHNCFVCAMGEHVRRAITSSGPFKAQWIQPYLKKIFPSHRPGYQEDAHELLTLILDALDPTPPAAAKQHNGPATNAPNQEPSASTPMEQLFGGALRNEIRCFGCGENYVNYERIRELNLGLRMRKREGIVGINDLLVDYFSNETLSSFECKKCKRKTQAQRVTRVIRAPHVLVVQLKRFNACGSKIRLPVTIEMNVKLDRFMYLADDRNAYSLCGLIEHQGEGIDRGHYIAFVRGFDGKGWHCFDDETCQRVSVEDVCKRQGYVMVYTRS
uniref:Ubiquitin carboxyl-terminal hydrolase 36 n=1 Tax=Ascaris suum TaxID=6253 RepID=F1KWJ3_ASCSU